MRIILLPFKTITFDPRIVHGVLETSVYKQVIPVHPNTQNAHQQLILQMIVEVYSRKHGKLVFNGKLDDSATMVAKSYLER